VVDPAVRDAYLEGLDAVRLAATTVDDWASPTRCAGWRAVDLAGHLVLVVRMYDAHLARATEELPARFASAGERRERNERELAELPPSSGPHRVGAFLDTARTYLARVTARPLALYRREDHVFTAADHLTTAAIEWHLHAWDLDARRAAPDCAPLLADAWRAHLPFPMGDGEPWQALLRASGRTP
jgi:hypothetical protein